MKNKYIFAVFSAAVLVIVAFSLTMKPPAQKEDLPPSTSDVAETLDTSAWEMTSLTLNGSENDDLSSFRIAVKFENDSISGKICNSFSGSYNLNNEVITAESIRSTKMACMGKLGEIENSFFKTLGHGASVKIDDKGELRLVDQLNSNQFYFRPYIDKPIEPSPIPPASSNAAEAVKKDVAQQENVNKDQVTVISVVPKEWPNSCLGVNKPDLFCLQAITPGYEITAKTQVRTYIYHTNESGSAVVLME